MFDAAEIRIKTFAQLNMPWHELPVLLWDCYKNGPDDDLWRTLRTMIETFYNIVEIRWNWEGYSQGHYIHGQSFVSQNVKIVREV